MTPDDVYAVVTAIKSMLGWSILLQVVMLLVVVPASVMFFREKKARTEFLNRSNRMLAWMESHAKLTDVKEERTVNAVDSIPAKVAEAVKQEILPVIAPEVDPLNPPKRRAEDRKP